MSNPDNHFESSFPNSPVYAVEVESLQDVKCEDVDLLSLSCRLTDRFSVEAVGHCLGLEDPQVHNALKRAAERCQDYNKLHLLLIKWQDLKGERATWGALIEQSQSNPEIADIIKKELQKNPPRIDVPPQQETNPQSPSAMTIAVKPFVGGSDDGQEEHLPLSEGGTSFRDSNEPEDCAFYQELVTGMSCQAMRFLNEPAKLEVSESARQFERRFAGLLCTAHSALKHAGITDSAIRIFLNEMSVSQKENIPLYEQRMAGIISHISLEEIILFCSRIGVWDFLNFQLLHDVANEFGIESLQAPLQGYGNAIDKFKRETKLTDWLHVWAGRNTLHTLPDSERVFARIKSIKWEEYTLADVARHEKYLAAEFRLRQLVFRFNNAGEGSVVLMWLVTKSVASRMEKIMRSNEKLVLDSMTFQELNIGGRIFKVTADYDSIYKHSISKPDVFWADRAKEYLHWEQPFDTVLEGDPPGTQWFRGGKINASVNCLDRHVARDPSTVAIVWEKNEPGEQEEVSYEELLEKTCQIANVLSNAGVKKGDKVMIYMPAMPLAVAAMLACARMGAVHCVVFSTFGPKDLKERISDTKPKVIITGDERVHGTETHALKVNIDEALKGSGHEVDRIFVASRTGKQVPMTPGRDVSLEKEMDKQPTEFDPVPMDSEDDLLVAYTSGTSGKPRRIVHTQAGYLLYAAFTHKFIFDFQPGDRFGCLADLGYIAGHTSVVYGPLCNGATTVLFEGVNIATYPDCERYWEMVDRLKLTHLYTAPTVIKFLMKAGNEHVDKYNLSSLKVLALAGEPVTPAIQEWCFNVVGRKKCLLLDTWWQTETGSIAITRWFAPEGKKPSHFPAKPSFPFFGVEPCLLTEEKPTLTGQDEVQGCLFLKSPLPGMGRKANDTYEEFKQLYFQHPKAEGYFYTYDLAKRDTEGNYQITGRVDDAIRIERVRLEVPKIENVMEYKSMVTGKVLATTEETTDSTVVPETVTYSDQQKNDGSESCKLRGVTESAVQTDGVRTEGYFRGAEVVGEVNLVITNEAMSFLWDGYGLKLNVPDNALPEGISEYPVNIKASLTGQFELPEGYELVSAVYWVYAPGKFSKPLTVEVQHCANFNNPNQLCFVRTSCTQESLPYRFKVVDGGSFTLSSKYGTLSTTHFSGNGIAKEVTPGEHSCQYCAQVYFTVKHMKDFWYCHFVVTKDMEMCLAMMKRKYLQVYDIAPPLAFVGDHIALDIPDDGIETTNGWRIVPLQRTKIKRDRVNRFSSEKSWVPECVLLLEWLHKSRAPDRLEYKVKLVGTGEEDDFFRIFLYPESFTLGSDNIPSLGAHVHTGESSDEFEAATAKHEPSKNSLDTRPTLPELIKFPSKSGITNIPQMIGTNYETFGTLLLNDKQGEKVDAITEKAGAQGANLAILKKWLRGEGEQPVTWRTLAKVLKDSELNTLAQEIEAAKNL